MQKWLRLEPHSHLLLRTLGRMYGKLDEAIATLGPAAEKHPSSTWVAIALGMPYLGAGTIENAVVEFHRLEKVAPDSPHVQWWLADDVMGQGDDAAATAYL